MWIRRNWLLVLTHISSLLPLAFLLWAWFNDDLTANPIQAITLRTGKTALILLILSLACTPLNTLFGLREVLRLRKWLGLYAFFYVAMHFLVFVGLDYGFDIDLLKEAIFEKRYALVGFSAGLILLPLALTSTQAWKRRLGKSWKRLHRFVYLAGVLAVIHYVWLVKSDIRVPLIYGGVVLILLVLRIPAVRRIAGRFRNVRKHLPSSLTILAK
jgi:sulfoxide reductase heme-binding subunit YedZ